MFSPDTLTTVERIAEPMQRLYLDAVRLAQHNQGQIAAGTYSQSGIEQEFRRAATTVKAAWSHAQAALESENVSFAQTRKKWSRQPANDTKVDPVFASEVRNSIRSLPASEAMATIMAGNDTTVFDAVMPFIETFGSKFNPQMIDVLEREYLVRKSFSNVKSAVSVHRSYDNVIVSEPDAAAVRKAAEAFVKRNVDDKAETLKDAEQLLRSVVLFVATGTGLTTSEAYSFLAGA